MVTVHTIAKASTYQTNRYRIHAIAQTSINQINRYRINAIAQGQALIKPFKYIYTAQGGHCLEKKWYLDEGMKTWESETEACICTVDFFIT